MDIWDGIIGATLGGIIAGVGSFFAIKLQLRAEQKLREKENKTKILSIICALYHELNMEWDLYMSSSGNLAEQIADGGTFEFTVGGTGNAFVIYDQNAQYLGLISDFALRDKIITAYICFKSLRGIFASNNQFLDEVAAAGERYAVEQTDNSRRAFQIKRTHLLGQSARTLRLSHSNAKEAVSEALSRLRPYVDSQAE
jgi:hypothetical protein